MDQYLGGLGRTALGEHVHGVEYLEAADAGDDDHEQRGRPEHRPGDEAEFVPAGSHTIDLCGIIKVPRDRHQAGKEQHHVEAEGLPDTDGTQRIERGAAILQPAIPFEADAREQGVDQAELGMEHELPHDRHGDQRGHDRQEVNGAIPAAQAAAALDQERHAEAERDGQWYDDGDIDDGVGERDPEHAVVQHLLIVGEADPAKRGGT